MHFLQALFLWLSVSGLSLGAAFVFHRFFREESPWFGFIIPPLAFVLLLNFTEHFVALPNLLILFPFLAGVIGWLAATSPASNKQMLLPSLIFLGSFAFTFAVRCLQPDILFSSDGLSDLNKINDYCQGDTLPPIDTWLPPFRYEWYYSMQHYAASIIKRLFDVKLGVAYNTSHALLSALTCVAGAAAAHRLGGGRVWIIVAIPFLIESAATGSSAYIHLTMHNPSMWYANNLSGGVLDYDKAYAADPSAPANPLWPLLASQPYRERLELQAPGFWTWRSEYHANASGHFLTLLAVFILAELSVLRTGAWPWIMAVMIPLLAIVSTTWALPLTLLLCGGIVLIALYCGQRPPLSRLNILLFVAGLVLIWPSFYDVTASPQVPDLLWTKAEWRVPFWEFIIQWWPVIALWLCGGIYFRELPPGLRWVLLVLPAMLIGVELITMEGRYNTVEKMWGYTYGAGLIALFPIVAQRAGLEELGLALRGFVNPVTVLLRPAGMGCRILTLALLFSALISLGAWIKSVYVGLPWGGQVFQLEGDSYLTSSEPKKRILHILSQVKHRTFLSGQSIWCYNESPAPAVFTENRSYSAWFYFETVADYGDEATYRSKLNNDFYSGAMAQPLKFLQQNSITGVLIWPDDAIPDAYLAKLKTELDPSYEYLDCRGNGNKNAGVFLLRPLPVRPD